MKDPHEVQIKWHKKRGFNHQAVHAGKSPHMLTMLWGQLADTTVKYMKNLQTLLWMQSSEEWGVFHKGHTDDTVTIVITVFPLCSWAGRYHRSVLLSEIQPEFPFTFPPIINHSCYSILLHLTWSSSDILMSITSLSWVLFGCISG